MMSWYWVDTNTIRELSLALLHHVLTFAAAIDQGRPLRLNSPDLWMEVLIPVLKINDERIILLVSVFASVSLGLGRVGRMTPYSGDSASTSLPWVGRSYLQGSLLASLHRAWEMLMQWQQACGPRDTLLPYVIHYDIITRTLVSGREAYVLWTYILKQEIDHRNIANSVPKTTNRPTYMRW